MAGTVTPSSRYRSGPPTPPPALVESLLRMANALGDTKALTTLLSAVGTPENGKYTAWQYVALAGLLDALDERATPLAKLQARGGGEVGAALKKVAGLFD